MTAADLMLKADDEDELLLRLGPPTCSSRSVNLLCLNYPDSLCRLIARLNIKESPALTCCSCHSEKAHQLDEIFSHAFIVLIDSMHNGINECLLVGLTQLSYIAKIHVCNPAI